MTRIFIDASVLFAASLSPTGASREIMLRAIRSEISLVISKQVLEETERNISYKAPEGLPFLRRVIDAISFETVRPTKIQVEQAAKYTALKDAAIVAAAKRAKVDYLVSLDRKHLVNPPEVAKRSKLKIVLPEELVRQLRR